MKYFVLVLLSLLACSCVLEPAKDIEFVNQNQIYLSAVSSTIEAWKMNSTLPQVTSSCKTSELAVRYYNDSLFKEISFYCAAKVENDHLTCQTENSSCPYGCATGFFRATQLHPIRRGNVYVIAMTENLKLLSNAEETIEYTIRHETIHWLSHCTGHEFTQLTSEDGSYYFPYSYSDSQHADSRLWNGTNSVIERSAILMQAANIY